jgi:excisionase family DNA binding protein
MDNVLSPADAAKELDCTTQWVTELLRTERLNGIKFGRQWVITREDLEAYKAERQKSKTAKE